MFSVKESKMWLKILPLCFHAVLCSIFVICSFFIAIALTPFYMYRLFVSTLAKILCPNTVGIVNPVESTLGEDNLTTRPKSAICGVIVLNGHATLAHIRSIFAEKLVNAKRLDGKLGKSVLSYPRFQQYPEKWLGLNFWNRANDFSIENHVRLYGNRKSYYITEREVINEIGSLRMLPFKKKSPLWEILYVENYLSDSDAASNNNVGSGTEGNDNSSAKTALIFRVHHMMADGYSLLTAFMKDLCGENMESLNRLPIKNVEKGSLSKIQIALELSNYILRSPYLILKQYLVDIDYHIWCTWQSKLTHQMLSNWTEKIPVATIKEISKRNKVSFTSVLLAGIAGGIREYFIKHNMKEDIPSVMRAIAAAPVNGHPYDRLCNHWTFVVIPLQTGMSTPEGRLRKTDETMLDLKTTPTPLINFYLMSVVGLLPSCLIKIFSQAFFGTAVMSNFPGPANKIKLGQEFPIEDMAFWPIFYRGRAGLGFTMLSYNDGVRISITIDKAHISTKGGLEELTKYIRNEFEVMRI